MFVYTYYIQSIDPVNIFMYSLEKYKIMKRCNRVDCFNECAGLGDCDIEDDVCPTCDTVFMGGMCECGRTADEIEDD